MKPILPKFTVSKPKMLTTARGVAWTTNLFMDGKKVGTVENRGDGGCNIYNFHYNDAGHMAQKAWEYQYGKVGLSASDVAVENLMQEAEGLPKSMRI